jgi:hypothetical protein
MNPRCIVELLLFLIKLRPSESVIKKWKIAKNDELKLVKKILQNFMMKNDKCNDEMGSSFSYGRLETFIVRENGKTLPHHLFYFHRLILLFATI